MKKRVKYILKADGKTSPVTMSRSYAFKMKKQLEGLSKRAGIKTKIRVIKKKR